MLFLVNMYWLTFKIALFYGIVMLVITSYFQFIQRGVFDFKVQKNKIKIYYKLSKRIRNVFDFFYSIFFILFLIYRYFCDENNYWFIAFSIIIFFHPLFLVVNHRRNKGIFFNPFRQIEVTNVGIVVNDELLVYDSQRDRVILIIKKLSTQRSIYYSISIANYYKSIEFIKPIPDYQFKEFIIKLQEFFGSNGIRVERKNDKN